MRRWWKLVLAVPVAVAVTVYAAAFVYVRVVDGDAPERLAFDTTGPEPEPTTPGAGSDGIEGAWTVTTGSQAGYRVEEVLFGQSATAVGRTSDVTGTFVIDGSGTQVRSGEFTIDMTTI